MTSPGSEGSAQGRESLLRNIKAWRSALVNLDGRNPLLYFKTTSTVKGVRKAKKGFVDFNNFQVDPSKYKSLLSGKTISVSQLHPDVYKTRQGKLETPETDTELLEIEAKKITQWNRLISSYEELMRKARENFEERNIETLFLVRGFVSWEQDRTGPSEPLAPLVLIPVKIKSIGRGHTDFEITISGSPIFNDALRLYLQNERAIDVSSFDPEVIEGLTTIQEVEKFFKEIVKQLPKGKFENIEAFGNFSFYKLPLVADMDRIAESESLNPILLALAGDQEALSQIAPFDGSDEPMLINEVEPTNEFLVFPTDRSQHLAISAIARGKNLVIQGPPGTGKSQTIANSIAELSAHGKSVLFVAEKRAAIEAVVNRLESKGLGSLVLDLHSEPDKKKIASQLLEVLYDQKEDKNASQRSDGELKSLRNKLQTRWKLMNQLSGISLENEKNATLYEAMKFLGSLMADGDANQEWPVELDLKALENLSSSEVSEIRKLLDFLSETKWLDGFSIHSSRGLRPYLISQTQCTELVDSIQRLNSQLIKGFSIEVETFTESNGYASLAIEELIGLIKASQIINQHASKFNVDDLIRASKEYEGIFEVSKLRSQFTFFVSLTEHFKRTRTLKRCFREKISKKLMFEICNAFWIHVKSNEFTNQIPVEPSTSLQEFSSELARIIDDFQGYGPVLSDLGKLDIGAATIRIEALYADLALIYEYPAINIARDSLIEISEFVKRILDWFEAEQPEVQHAGTWVYMNWLKSTLDTSMRKMEYELKITDLNAMDRILDQYQKMDEVHIRTNSMRVISMIKSKVQVISNTEGFSKLRREADKKAAHLPFRKLLDVAKMEVQTLKPCFAMSPIEVSRLLPCEMGMFDVVIFDEASQITPEDAIPSIYRSKQVVVAGDKYQLGPTNFGKAMDDSEDTDISFEVANLGLESILDFVRNTLPITNTYPLQTHYRSEDERLITFSNRAFYAQNNQSLFTFPSKEANPRKSLGYKYVEDATTKGMAEEANSKEIDAVVACVLEHVTEKPDASLGIIAFGDQHKRRIQDALLKLEQEDDSYFDFVGRFANSAEPLFIKNIERVQGDERDAIIISPGYARNDKGALRFQFGWLSREGGERRLNVAASRAKQKMTLVTSIKSDDFKGYSGQQRGVLLLKALLQYMENFGHSMELGDVPPAPENPFEEQILQLLSKEGLKIDCQVGDSGYRIDFAVRNPKRDDEYILAIEADGASYHSSDYARERDIVRQKVLESRGWQFVRIWSTDWFRNRNGEIEKVLSAYRAAQTGQKANHSFDASTPKVNSDLTDLRSLDQKLFDGLKQSNKLLSKEYLLSEWMKLCGHTRKTQKVLVRFDELWNDSVVTKKVSTATDRLPFEKINAIPTNAKPVISLTENEVNGLNSAFKTRKSMKVEDDLGRFKSELLYSIRVKGESPTVSLYRTENDSKAFKLTFEESEAAILVDAFAQGIKVSFETRFGKTIYCEFNDTNKVSKKLDLYRD
jgi:very-short-patch-repair endonuclease